eukprot:jgi/Phyca11/96080/e_gw1.1.573.1
MVGTRGSAPHKDVAGLPEERGSNHFRLIWPEFKKLGWTSKPPPSRGIETRWKYILPGGNASGTVGIDYVLGEQAVVDHAMKCKVFDILMYENDEEVFENEERHFADHFLEEMGGEEQVLAGEVLGPALKELSTTGWHDAESPDVERFLDIPYTPVSNDNEYPDLLKVQHGPTNEALKRGSSPISLFFLFMPVGIWQHIAECSNFYMHEQLDKRVDTYFEKKKSREQKAKAAGKSLTPTKKSKTRRDVRQDFLSVKPFLPHELCVYIGLLIARTVMPNREKLVNHWRQDD